MSSTGAGGGERTGGFNGLLVALLVISIIFAVVDFGLLSYKAGQDAKASALVTRAQVLSQQLSRQSNDAAGGNLDAFGTLKATRDSIADLITRLKQGDTRNGMDGYAGYDSLKGDFAALDDAWKQLSTDAGKILDSKEQIIGSGGNIDEFNRKTAVLNSRMDEVVKILTERTASTNQVMIASRQMLYADRMQRRAQSIIQGGEDSPTAAAAPQRDAQFYGQMLAGPLNGEPGRNVKAMDKAAPRRFMSDT